MEQPQLPGFARLDQSDLTLAEGEQDIRGRDVVDEAGQEVGTITGLFVDESERRVRFLEVKGGGILGFGDEVTLVPVEAVRAIKAERVMLAHPSSKLAGAPRYDPALTEQPDWTELYGYYGYSPYWPPDALTGTIVPPR
jgi:sporulation protein YlmC with PRC-barrel domain